MKLPIGTYTDRSPPAGVQRLINVYPEQNSEKGVVLRRAPGIATFATIGSGPIRGMRNFKGKLYVVSGAYLYRVNPDGSSVQLGGIPGEGRVSIADNGIHLCVVADQRGFITQGAAVEEIVDEEFRAATDVDFIDNYLVFVEANSGRFFCSDLADATSYDGLNFATAEAQPDKLVGLIVDHREIFLAGETTCEIWYNDGSTGFPFARDSNGVVEIGCADGNSLVKADNSIFWLANDFTIRRLNGITPVRVSQHQIEQAITDMRDRTCHAFSWVWDGHVQICFDFETRAFIYDINTNEWHERATFNGRGNAGVDRWQVTDSVLCYEKWFVGSNAGGQIGYFDSKTYTEFGEIQRCEWTYAPVYGQNVRAFHRRFEVMADPGGTAEVMLAVSDDGGYTFRNLGTKSLGERGEFKGRAVWHRLGTARNRIYRAAITDPVKFTVYDTQLMVEAGKL